MVEYGCNVANKFGFMSISSDDECSDPQELIVKAAKVAEEKEKAAQRKAVVEKSVAPTSTKDSKPVGKENNKPGSDRARGGRGRGRGGARPPRESTDVADRFGEYRGRGGRGRGGRGRGAAALSEEHGKDTSFEEGNQENVPVSEGFRGSRRGGARFTFRGIRGGRGRAFDRQSGSDRTGVRPAEKKDGHGKGNWGSSSDELAGETEAVPETVEPEVPREKTEEELAYEAQLAEYNKMKTLKEFRAAQKTERESFNTRQASDFSGAKLIPLQKQKVADSEEEEVIVVRKESNKKLLNVDIRFSDPTHSGRGDREHRGPRGRGNFRGGRGGVRGHQDHAFDTSIEEFPALGAH